jgi:hypothetical protein
MDIFAYDFDGVVSIGVRPRNENDIIITGRCEEEAPIVLQKLKELQINCRVYFNPMTLKQRGDHTVKARTYSGLHKASKIAELKKNGIHIVRFFEDDPIQKEIIAEQHTNLDIVHIVSNLVQK